MELKKYRFEQAGSHDFEQLQRLRHSTSKAVVSLKSLRQQRLALGDQIGSLERQWAGFRESTIREQRQHAMSKTFADYKDEYRAYARGKAKGETIETLETLTGVIYHNAIIREVTAIGIQIRHDEIEEMNARKDENKGVLGGSGSKLQTGSIALRELSAQLETQHQRQAALEKSRIQAPDLDPKMQDRFQWSDEGRRSRLKEELEHLIGKPDKDDPAIVEDGAAVAPDDPLLRPLEPD